MSVANGRLLRPVMRRTEDLDPPYDVLATLCIDAAFIGAFLKP